MWLRFPLTGFKQTTSSLPQLHAFWPRIQDDALEQSYSQERMQKVVQPFVKISFLLGAVLFAAYGIADWLVRGYFSAEYWRYLIGFPICVLAWSLTYWSGFTGWGRWIQIFFGMGPAIGSLGIAVSLSVEAAILYMGWISIFVSVAPLVAKYDVMTQIIYVIISVLMLAIALILGPSFEPGVVYGLLWTTITMGMFGTILAWLDERHDRSVFLNQITIVNQAKEIERERGRSEALLGNILPKTIASRLKDGVVIADTHDEVTVVFADIVGFTELSATLTPQQLVQRLDNLFSAFDEACKRRGIEKIKTIGDAYMAVSGIPDYVDNHAHRAVLFALDMLTIVNQMENSTKTLSIRVGIHSGPLVAGVIGKHKFAYDTWGDTVNTASRMESHASTGTIQVSESVYRQTKAFFPYITRGEIEIKGKGLMTTWMLTNPEMT
jgi:adenylate cyclase